jgi:NAD(P)-dependent dehydrogenase (short-subunit alcohol dehydrogenase family)
MKTAIVTGAAGNLGREVVKRLLASDFKVTGTVMPGDSIEFPGQHFEKITVDLLNEVDTQKAITSIVSSHSSVDVAVLTVGGFAMGDIAGTTTNDIMNQYRINFETAWNMARPIFIEMKKQKAGRIFMIGSRPGLDAKSGKGMIAYGLAKSLVFRLAELMNEEGNEQNIVTSVIIPGTIDTPQNRKAMPEADFSKWVSAEEIANTICFYCSEAARSIREPMIKIYGNL